MKIDVKKLVAMPVLALALAGCSSYSEIARWNSDATINDGEVPLATFITQNFSYQFLWFAPFCTGRPWTEGTEEVVDDFRVKFFADEATLDNNLVSLKHAMELVGSNRVTQLESFEEDSSMWSCFLFNRHEIRTTCIILRPEESK